MLRTIGLMSGTSLDGVDAAWLETDGIRVGRFGPALTLPYDDALRADLRRLLDLAPGLAADHPFLADVTARLTERHAEAVKALCGILPAEAQDRRAAPSPNPLPRRGGEDFSLLAEPLGRADGAKNLPLPACGERVGVRGGTSVNADLIGLHGQTILHDPARRRTWQIGDAAALAAATGIPVAWNFRAADVAAGGEGAPLAPVFHAALAADLQRPLAVLNVGGVANVTWIGRDGRLVAFDTGPGNGPLDDWAERRTGQPCDRDGALSGEGLADEAVLAHLLNHRYFRRPPPKSLDRLGFARALAESGMERLSAADGAATLVAFLARAVAAAPLPEPPLRWLVGGGGRRNPSIMSGLGTLLRVPVEPVEAVGWDGDALEAQCFGFLAARVAAGLPLSFPETTGVPWPMPGGTIARPHVVLAATN
jgi:anhydro-N-acetylmuramic acid kinase